MFEGCLAENFSAIVRPEYLFSTYDVVMDEDGFGVSAFGLTLGIRHYFKSNLVSVIISNLSIAAFSLNPKSSMPRAGIFRCC